MDRIDRIDLGEARLAQEISAMTENEISQFISRERRVKRLSQTVRSLNRDALSDDRERRARAEAAIRKLGFI